MILCDTNILIEFYKGTPDVVDALRMIGLPEIAISVVTAGELYFGAKDKHEMRRIIKHLSLLRQLPIDEDVSDAFLRLLETYALSHGLNIPDALIAATALQHKLPLYTLNIRDFHFIADLHLYTPGI
ncbi:MAG: type II toxin-antitoxin system VapC family toxin [Chloroflexota bacterium]